MPPPVARRTLLFGAGGALLLPGLARGREQDHDVPYVPTPLEVVEGMLDMAELRAGERLIDLGSGDGRIAIAAARRGAEALGVEIDQRLVNRARTLAESAGQPRARFLRADLFTVSLRDADVVTLYLLPAVNERLKPKLLVELRPGARVVSHAFDMGDWVPDLSRTVADKNVYRWTIPAIAGGEWRLVRPDGAIVLLALEQRYDRITGTLDGRAVSEGRLSGTSIVFRADDIVYRGVVGERAITGQADMGAWRAYRPE